MIPIFPVIELIDRLAIAEIKWQKTKSNYDELSWYREQIAAYDFSLIQEMFSELKEIHNKIWELEWQLKTGVEQQLSLEEIGRRAILIRDYNNKRIKIKNQIAEKVGCSVKEFKQDHLSQ